MVTNSNNLHCLNSREYLSTAQGEGWGHFFSSKVFNDFGGNTCSFVYYKDTLSLSTDWNGNHVVLHPPIDTRVSCNSPMKWRNSFCGLQESGTEWDWLTFLTNVHTQGTNKLSMAELADVWQRACGSSGVKCSGQVLSWSATSVPFNRPDGGPAVASPLNTAAEAKFGILSAKYGFWLATSDANGVSNNLTP